MKPALYPLPALAVTVLFLIRAQLRGQRRQVFFLKPAATLLVIAVALLSLLEPHHTTLYTVGILIALTLSLGGDVALIFDDDRHAFMLGLTLFLLAHIAYAILFTVLGRFSGWDAISALVLLLAGIGFYALIQNNLGRMRLPVIAYMVVISVMVNRAVSTLVSPRLTPALGLMVASGAVLFYISDMILAANRFWRPWRYDRISLVFYYAGQALIALAGSFFP